MKCQSFCKCHEIDVPNCVLLKARPQSDPAKQFPVFVPTVPAYSPLRFWSRPAPIVFESCEIVGNAYNVSIFL